MKTYYVQYDVWRDGDIVPTVERTQIQASSKEEVILKIQDLNGGVRIKSRLIYVLDDNSPRRNSSRSIGSRLGFLVIGCIGLLVVFGRFFKFV